MWRKASSGILVSAGGAQRRADVVQVPQRLAVEEISPVSWYGTPISAQ